MDKKNVKLSVVVPAYNEINTIEQILKKVKSQQVEGVEIEVVVVDDGSKDGTREFLDTKTELYDIYHKNPKNLGKGGAVKEALKLATGEYILFQDADLEYDPDDYSILLDPVVKYNADVVMGSRFLAPKWTRVFYFWHKVGNLAITTCFNIFYNTTWTDIYSCYLIFRKDLIEPEKLITEGWEQQAEILGKVCKKGKAFYEVPITYNGRTFEEGKKIKWYHIFKVFYTIMKVRLF